MVLIVFLFQAYNYLNQMTQIMDKQNKLSVSYKDHRMGYVAMIMLYCGLRKGEVLALEWKDIDLERKML